MKANYGGQVESRRAVVEGEVKNLKELVEKALEEKKIEESLEDFSNLTKFLEKVIDVKSKREVSRNPKDAFKSPIVVVTDRGAPLGAFINFSASKELPLPKDLRFFLYGLIQASICKRR